MRIGLGIGLDFTKKRGVLIAPVATAATSVTGTSFVANWNAYDGATTYYLDVSTSPTFATFVLQNQAVSAPATSYTVTGLTACTYYYYRVRAEGNKPTISIAPTLSPSGTQGIGTLITCATGTWNNQGSTFNYQWKRNGVSISGATSSTYTLQAIDNGTVTTCEVQNQNAFGKSPYVVTSNNVLGSYIVATGGTITTDGDYKVHTFTGSGNFVITSGAGDVEYLIVAGGGGAGAFASGGGGAGGLLTGTQNKGVGTYPVVIGAGGTVSTNGSSSTLFGLTTIGGGFGGRFSNIDVGSGGSGGGSASYRNLFGTGTSGQGNNGGTSTGDGGGGGGGAGAVGSSTTGFNGANGGNGVQFYGVYYAGGGGGGSNSTAGTGGLGGGGNGGSANSQAGSANTGGGGGGDRLGNFVNGGSGIVIVRYKFQ